MPSCPYGSEPRPGAPNGFWLTLQGVLAFLPSALNAWLAWSPEWLDGLYVSTVDLCAAPQPSVGAFPAADYLACQLAPLAEYGSSCQVVRSWFNAYVRSLLWSNQCQCVGGTNVVCASGTTGPITDTGSGSSNLLHAGPYVAYPNAKLAVTLRRVAGTPPGSWSATIQQSTGGAYSAIASGTYGQMSTSVSIPPGGGPTALSPSATEWYVNYAYGTGWGTQTFYMDWSIRGDCGGGPLPAPATPSQPSTIVSLPSGACSTTADLCAELLRLEQYVSELSATVQYMTRQSVPYSYRLGTPSSGLSGNGYVAITECMGVLITLTTIPSAKGRQTGTPTRYFDVGRINWGDLNGYHAHHPIHQSPELILGVPDTATRIGYTFPSGVVATITPVLRV